MTVATCLSNMLILILPEQKLSGSMSGTSVLINFFNKSNF